ncbi:hypothetical protein STVA_37360 [Allostella vacuolata]|nr:hypothetical protein STVA_37360 [Stella vacuolata]
MICAGPTLEGCDVRQSDVRQSYGEVRIAALGRHDVRRIVSARLANRKERKLWQEVFG